MFVTVGSSGAVYPAAGLPEIALRNGARLVILNAEETPFDPLADVVGNVVDQQAEGLHADRPVLERRLAQQVDPQPVAADDERSGATRQRQLVIAHHDQPDVGHIETRPPRRGPTHRGERQPDLAAHTRGIKEIERPRLVPRRAGRGGGLVRRLVASAGVHDI